MRTSSRRGTQHWPCLAPVVLAWMDSASTSLGFTIDTGSIADSNIREVDLELAAATAPTQAVEVSIHQSFAEEPAITTCRAPTMDIVSTVPLCGVLISGAHASPLVVTANQTTAPLLVAGPSFPPVMQGPINMLPGAPISLTGAPGMLPALYSAIQSARAPPALYNAMQSAAHSAALQRITGIQPAQQASRQANLWSLLGSAMIWRQER